MRDGDLLTFAGGRGRGVVVTLLDSIVVRGMRGVSMNERRGAIEVCNRS